MTGLKRKNIPQEPKNQWSNRKLRKFWSKRPARHVSPEECERQVCIEIYLNYLGAHGALPETLSDPMVGQRSVVFSFLRVLPRGGRGERSVSGVVRSPATALPSQASAVRRPREGEVPPIAGKGSRRHLPQSDGSSALDSWPSRSSRIS